MPNKDYLPNYRNHRGQSFLFCERLSLLEDTIEFFSGQSQRQQQRNKLHITRIFGESGSANGKAIDAALPGLRAVSLKMFSIWTKLMYENQEIII